MTSEDIKSILENIKSILENIKSILEKQTAIEPDLSADGYDDNGELLYDTWICPVCGADYEVEYDVYDYCPHCGQKLITNKMRI